MTTNNKAWQEGLGMLDSSKRVPQKEKGEGSPVRSHGVHGQQLTRNGNEAQTQLMDVRGVAAYLNLDRQTIYNWLHQQKISGIKVGGVWRFDRRTIDEWLQARTVGTGERASHVAPQPAVLPPKE